MKRFVMWARYCSLPARLWRWRRTEEAYAAMADKAHAAEMRNMMLIDELEAARAAPTWKQECVDEVLAHKATRLQLNTSLAECASLKSGETASGLSPAEVERVALLAMAAGKLAADAAKVILHGWGSPSPVTGRPVYAEVEHGIGRLWAAAELMMEAGDVRGGDVKAHTAHSKNRILAEATRQ